MARKNPKSAKKLFEEQLPVSEKWMDEYYAKNPVRNRAGQMLCFHPVNKFTAVLGGMVSRIPSTKILKDELCYFWSFGLSKRLRKPKT